MAKRTAGVDSSAQESCDRGRLYLERQQYDKAVAAFSDAIRLKPQFAAAYRDRGRAYLLKGDRHSATNDFCDAIKIDHDLLGEISPDLDRLQSVLAGPHVSFAETLEDIPLVPATGTAMGGRKDPGGGEDASADPVQLLKMVQQVLACDTLRHFSEMVGSYAATFFAAASGALYFRSDSASARYRAVRIWGEHVNPRQERTLEQNQCWALAKMGAYCVMDCRKSPRCEHVPQRGGSALCVPLMAHGEALGVLHVRSGPGKLTAQQKTLAARLARVIGPAFWTFRTREKYREEAIRDERTGLFTSRNMRESLARELHRAARKRDESIGIIMLDIDHFKEFNSNYTHEGANTLLRKFGKFLQKRFRGADVACRYGGDEFVILLPGTSLEQTRQRAERLREEISNLRIHYRERWLGPITTSLGVAASPVNGSNPDDLLHAAACALRKAKESGRDRVELAPSLSQSTGGD